MEIQLWRELLDPYQLAVDELTVKFHHIIEEHRNQGLYSPIESVDGRVKSIVSILDKMQRKNVSMNDIEKKIEDLAGIRIICQFVEDIDRVVNLIKNRTDICPVLFILHSFFFCRKFTFPVLHKQDPESPDVSPNKLSGIPQYAVHRKC